MKARLLVYRVTKGGHSMSRVSRSGVCLVIIIMGLNCTMATGKFCGIGRK